MIFVTFTVHDAEALALSASRVEQSGKQMLKACDSLIDLLPALKKQIEVETTFAEGQARKFKALAESARDSVVG